MLKYNKEAILLPVFPKSDHLSKARAKIEPTLARCTYEVVAHPKQIAAQVFRRSAYQESNPIMDDSKPDIQLSHFYHMAQKLGSFATVCRYNN